MLCGHEGLIIIVETNPCIALRGVDIDHVRVLSDVWDALGLRSGGNGCLFEVCEI